jgi:NAD(P)-dependent dehydrogenase (short-subunit alcohol dehydrogenase family)
VSAGESIRLEHRVVVVTGASSGLGRAYARALAGAGARLIVVARRRELLSDLVAELGDAAVAVAGDVANPATAEAITDAALSSFGRLDVVVNNAGGLRDRTLLKMTDEEFDEVLRAHVYGTFYVTRACARAMRDGGGGGSIINIGSDSGLLGAFGQSNYAAAKGAIHGLTLTWAQELARHNITCNCVLPNAYTAMTENLPELLAAYRYGPPEAFPRALGQPADVAPLIVLLASERWRALNGRILSLGGDRLSLWQPPNESRMAYLSGGWSVEELDRSLAAALGLSEPEPIHPEQAPDKRSPDGATYG